MVKTPGFSLVDYVHYKTGYFIQLIGDAIHSTSNEEIKIFINSNQKIVSLPTHIFESAYILDASSFYQYTTKEPYYFSKYTEYINENDGKTLQVFTKGKCQYTNELLILGLDSEMNIIAVPNNKFELDYKKTNNEFSIDKVKKEMFI